MNAFHHPSDEVVLQYANGSLGYPLSLIVAGHLDGCGQCRETVALAESLGGIFLDRAARDDIGPEALDRALERLDALTASGPVPTPQKPQDPGLPPSLRGQPVRRRRWIGPGMWVRPMCKDKGSGARAYLLGVAAGRAIPRHGHHGLEVGLIIRGNFTDEDAKYVAGDFFEIDDFRSHRPVVGIDGECICAIGSQGLPTGWLGLLIRLVT